MKKPRNLRRRNRAAVRMLPPGLLRLPILLASAFSLNSYLDDLGASLESRRLASSCDSECVAGVVSCDMSCDSDCSSCLSKGLCGLATSCSRDGSPTEGCDDSPCEPPSQPPALPPPVAPPSWIDSNQWLIYILTIPTSVCILYCGFKTLCGILKCNPCVICCPGGFSLTKSGSGGVELNFA